MSRDRGLTERLVEAALPLRCGFLLFICSAAQYLAWQFDLEWLRRPVPLFPAIYPWTIVGFFGTSLILVFLARATRTDSAHYQAAAKALGVTIGSVALVFLFEHVFSKPISPFDALFFRETLVKAGGSLAGRPAVQTCVTFLLLAVATQVFDREGKRRIGVSDHRRAGHVFTPLDYPWLPPLCHCSPKLGY
jgi:hypothetical protein